MEKEAKSRKSFRLNQSTIGFNWKQFGLKNFHEIENLGTGVYFTELFITPGMNYHSTVSGTNSSTKSVWETTKLNSICFINFDNEHYLRRKFSKLSFTWSDPQKLYHIFYTRWKQYSAEKRFVNRQNLSYLFMSLVE